MCIAAYSFVFRKEQLVEDKGIIGVAISIILHSETEDWRRCLCAAC